MRYSVLGSRQPRLNRVCMKNKVVLPGGFRKDLHPSNRDWSGELNIPCRTAQQATHNPDPFALAGPNSQRQLKIELDRIRAILRVVREEVQEGIREGKPYIVPCYMGGVLKLLALRDWEPMTYLSACACWLRVEGCVVVAAKKRDGDIHGDGNLRCAARQLTADVVYVWR